MSIICVLASSNISPLLLPSMLIVCVCRLGAGVYFFITGLSRKPASIQEAREPALGNPALRAALGSGRGAGGLRRAAGGSQIRQLRYEPSSYRHHLVCVGFAPASRSLPRKLCLAASASCSERNVRAICLRPVGDRFTSISHAAGQHFCRIHAAI